MSTFENAYNFVPAPPRDTAHPELGDHTPPGQHRYHPGRVSGTIDIEIETVTPLLIPDEGTIDDQGHKTFGIRVDANGVPYLPPTSLKGMLRAAYEAVTNSRFGVFAKHEERLAYRAEASSALKLVPCRAKLIESKKTGERMLMIELLNGDTAIGANGEPTTDDGQPPLTYAAWLHRYDRSQTTDRGSSTQSLKYPDGSLPQHGDRVWVKVEERAHRSGRFRYLQVTAIRNTPPAENEGAAWREGWVYVSGPNIDRKHDERVFLKAHPNVAQPSLRANPALEAQWRELIRNYQAIHEDEIDKRRAAGHAPSDYLGDEPGKTAFSRHVYTKGSEVLKAGVLAYAAVRTQQEGDRYKVSEILALYPVQISRRLYAAAPAELLHPSLHPAETLAELSPADRLFGWVNQGGQGAWRGQLRIGRIDCDQGATAIERFPDAGVPLAILAAPKPQQARFYGAKDKNGEPYPKKTPKNDLYAEKDHGLRGRKVYPHHALLEKLSDAQKQAYWRDNGGGVEEVARIDGRSVYREWLRLAANGPESRRDDQNRSMTAWVKPGTVFRTRLNVTNLSSVEAGALLWLLSLPQGHYHRLGGGKPLGFGSVRIRITSCALHDGKDIAQFYASFGQEHAASLDPQGLIATYQRSICEIAGSREFENVPFIQAFLNAAKGGNLPMRYPRLQAQPNAEGKQYEWFVENERQGGRQLLHAHSLPAGWKSQRDLPHFGHP